MPIVKTQLGLTNATSHTGFPVAVFVARLKAPVEFASRTRGSRLGGIRNLGAFLTRCVREGLNSAALESIQPQLGRLADLLHGYDELPPDRKHTRLVAIRQVVDELVHGQAPSTSARAALPRLDPDVTIERLPGVGPRKASALQRLGVHTVRDLAWMLPWRYLDRAHPIPIGTLRTGDEVTICGSLASVEAVVTSRRRLRIVQGVLDDGTGSLVVKWFNQAYIQNRLVPGQVLICSGRVKQGRGLFERLEMDNPQFEIGASDDASLHTGRVVPIYHETRGINSRLLRGLVNHVLKTADGLLDEYLPLELRTRCGLLPRKEAFRNAHFPPADADLSEYQAGSSPSHRRLAFDELFLLELGLAVRRRETEHEIRGAVFRCESRRLDAFWKALPFTPTTAQRRVVGEIIMDLRAARPMNRLIQGDVGCGKTVVAAAAMWMVAGDGYQAALMAPTELLAEQHHRQLERILGGLGLRVAMVTSDSPRRERVASLDRLARREIDCVVGTHALVQPDVRFARFGLAVIDEQHKFGVLQRSHLVGKGYHPDVLIMTATPIPRTLAMSVYGDLDISVIDEMPAGRVPVVTKWYGERQRPLALDLIRREVRAGRQAYVVAPVLEESAEGEIRSAVELATRLRTGAFADTAVGLLHGKLKRAEKDGVMRRFLEGAIGVLVATTVVEVGIDVPNATVMMIEHADRYGLAQLHQLRGRVGRGAHRSLCLLMSSGHISEDARHRLDAMVAVHDGFMIAERDLVLRGPGEVLGTRQSGLPDLKVANLVRDVRLLERARAEAFDLVRRDPALSEPAHADLKAALRQAWNARPALRTIG